MTAKNILAECLRRQMRLTPAADEKLLYEFVNPPDAAFLEILRENKPALLALLTGKRHLAKQILQGEFTGCDGRTWKNILAEMLENNLDTNCLAALRHLKASQKTPNHR